MSGIIIAKGEGEGIYEEKKSRFIAHVYPVTSEEEVTPIIEAVRKKYWDARHNCYAYVCGKNNEVTRCSDDGEPSGTAGKPILEVITKSEVHNCLVIVTRYFGGTLLGTGGLVRAYTQSAKDALIDSELAMLTDGISYLVTADYNSVGKLQHIAADYSAIVAGTEYAENVKFTLNVDANMAEAMVDDIIENTNGRAQIDKICDLPIEKPYSLA